MTMIRLIDPARIYRLRGALLGCVLMACGIVLAPGPAVAAEVRVGFTQDALTSIRPTIASVKLKRSSATSTTAS